VDPHGREPSGPGHVALGKRKLMKKRGPRRRLKKKKRREDP